MAAIAAAERLTMRITATDSLKSCCRLGQTTRRSSPMVAATKPASASAAGAGVAASPALAGLGWGESGSNEGLQWRARPGLTQQDAEAARQTNTLPDVVPPFR